MALFYRTANRFRPTHKWNSYWEISYTGKGTSCTGFPFFMLVM